MIERRALPDISLHRRHELFNKYTTDEKQEDHRFNTRAQTYSGHDGQQNIHKHKEFNKYITSIQNKYTSIAASMIKTNPNKSE